MSKKIIHFDKHLASSLFLQVGRFLALHLFFSVNSVSSRGTHRSSSCHASTPLLLSAALMRPSLSVCILSQLSEHCSGKTWRITFISSPVVIHTLTLCMSFSLCIPSSFYRCLNVCVLLCFSPSTQL